MESFNYIQQASESRCDFLTIYIKEAHAMDVWPDGYQFTRPIRTPRSKEERIIEANAFITELGYELPMVCDTMDEEFLVKYSSWPIRIFIIDEEGKLEYIQEPTSAQVDTFELIEILTKHKIILN